MKKIKEENKNINLYEVIEEIEEEEKTSSGNAKTKNYLMTYFIHKGNGVYNLVDIKLIFWDDVKEEPYHWDWKVHFNTSEEAENFISDFQNHEICQYLNRKIKSNLKKLNH